jgi:hypothetical protein
MSYRTHCDWCGEWLSHGADQAVMQVTIYHRNGRGTLEAKWAEETRPTRHFCAAPKEDTDDGGRNRMGLVPEDRLDSCYDRAIAAITGSELRDPGMGMEWRLMPVDAPHVDPSTGAPRPVKLDWAAHSRLFDERMKPGGIGALEDAIPPSAWSAVVRTGIVTIAQLEALTDEQLLAMRGIGATSVRRIREAIAVYRLRQQQEVKA